MQSRKITLILWLVLFVAQWSGMARSAEQDCIYCGMHRSNYPHSWVIISYEDGSTSGVCSIHCAAIDIALHTAKSIRKVTVGDFDTREQIDADSAYWVIGGDLMGVMTARAKWAFANKDGADNFMKIHGGRLADFNEVIKAAFEDMYQDTVLLRKKHKLINLRKNQSQ